ncbi:MAG: amino acid permease [Chloroflexi bacterium]|nr:amino acid permease [Chloroflexota bacterium]
MAAAPATGTAGTSTATPPIRLPRTIGLVAATGSGVAIIVGAGVYVLLGEAAGRAGNAVWLSFVVAGAAALFTGLSYAELSAMYPRDAGGYTYAKEAFGGRVAFVVGWLTLFAQVISVAAVALGFGAYFNQHLGLPRAVAGALLTVACGWVAYRGSRETTTLGAVLSILEVGGLVAIIVAAFGYWGDVNYVETAKGISGIFGGASLVFFAFLGFEQIADMAGEIRNPERNLPLAILVSGGVSAALYIGAALAAVSVLGWNTLSGTDAPLVEVAKAAMGAPGANALFAIALISTASTALIALMAATRTIYGMAVGGSLPSLLGRVHPRRETPWIATAAVAAIATLTVVVGKIGVVAEMTNVAILLVFLVVNAALITLRRKARRHRRPFRIPGSIAGVPVTGLLGIGTTLLLLASADLWPLVLGLTVAGST